MSALLNHVKTLLQPAMEHWKKRSDWSNTPKYFDNISFENLNEAEDKQKPFNRTWWDIYKMLT